METIIEMLLLGAIAGMISTFWTRIIKEDMILSFVNDWMERMSTKYALNTGRGEYPVFVYVLRCMYCITPWIVFLLSAIYIITYHPVWYLAVIGVFGALGAGNFICEVVHALRRL